jgi:hypothetical protein
MIHVAANMLLSKLRNQKKKKKEEEGIQAQFYGDTFWKAADLKTKARLGW